MPTTQANPATRTRTYTQSIAEQAAATLVSRLNLLREPQETNIQALAWALGETDMLTYENALELVVEAALLAHAESGAVAPQGPLVSTDGALVTADERQAYWDALLSQGPSDQ